MSDLSSDEATVVPSTTTKESKKEKKLRKSEKKSKSKKSKDTEEEHSEQEHEDSDDNNTKDTPEDEIEIDLSASVPLSKKQQRLLKKGKLDLDKLAKKHPIPKPANEEPSTTAPKKSEFGVWIGNLSFDTTKEDLIRFIVGKTSQFEPNNESLPKIEESDISRVNIPKKDAVKIKGFAYVDVPSINHVNSIVSLSESILNGRKLLIKNANSFEGRPAADSSGSNISKNPPSRILFVGNLSFDTSEDNLQEHFRHCGEIVRIRMATFEDTGKCKGFAFIDFKDESGPTTALKSKLAQKLINRKLRLEYGEDRSKRNPNMRKREEGVEQEGEVKEYNQREPAPVQREPEQREYRERQQDDYKPKKRVFKERKDDNKRLKSSVALATAQRASAAIVQSTGKKIKFD
ncbi:NOP13 [[Candida] subhashii]|uniref:NOP13 n=1 Tax=[Candida] subhashii TaxID=561895 RepID=A0A8J5UL53_9ASCO|nr:NOP13 [[Candida] subhashii]KAG7662507.1 NOP13 [[Candida] subhashii]